MPRLWRLVPTGRAVGRWLGSGVLAAVLCTAMAGAQQVDLTVQPENGALADRLQRASATVRLAAQGDPTAEQVIAAARALGMEVHDHLIVGRKGVASFKQLGLM